MRRHPIKQWRVSNRGSQHPLRRPLAALSRETQWKLLATGAAIIAGVTARSALRAGWRNWKHEEPTFNPASHETAWSDAVIWAVATGAAVGLARLVARRGAAAGWQRIRGTLPPGV